MIRGVNRGGFALSAVAMVALLGCTATDGSTPRPPTIQAVGIATDVRISADQTRYAFAEGSVHEVPNSSRQIGDGGFGLVIIGSDSEGPFVAGFPTQDGLPGDCYRENAAGVDRGGYIETQGVLWAKAPTFASPVHPAPGASYPAGSRFCFDETGRIASVIDG